MPVISAVLWRIESALASARARAKESKSLRCPLAAIIIIGNSFEMQSIVARNIGQVVAHSA